MLPPLMVGQHRPETTQHFGRDPRSQLWNVALQVGADEIPPPSPAGRQGFRQVAFWKTAPQPQAVEIIGFGRRKRWQLEVRNPTREGLAALAEQIRRGRPQHQVTSRPPPLAPRPVDLSPHDRKQSRDQMDLIEDEQLVRMLAQIELRIAEFVAIRGRLQIEIEGRTVLGNLQGQRRLADLPGSQQRHRRGLVQPFHQSILPQGSRNHHCKYGPKLLNYKEE